MHCTSTSIQAAIHVCTKPAAQYYPCSFSLVHNEGCWLTEPASHRQFPVPALLAVLLSSLLPFSLVFSLGEDSPLSSGSESLNLSGWSLYSWFCATRKYALRLAKATSYLWSKGFLQWKQQNCWCCQASKVITAKKLLCLYIDAIRLTTYPTAELWAFYRNTTEADKGDKGWLISILAESTIRPWVSTDHLPQQD